MGSRRVIEVAGHLHRASATGSSRGTARSTNSTRTRPSCSDISVTPVQRASSGCASRSCLEQREQLARLRRSRGAAATPAESSASSKLRRRRRARPRRRTAPVTPVQRCSRIIRRSRVSQPHGPNASRAARVERAAGGRVGRRRAPRRAAGPRAIAARRVGVGDRAQQRLGVRVPRVVEDLGGRRRSRRSCRGT